MGVPIDQLEPLLKVLPSWVARFVDAYKEEAEELSIQEGRPPSLWLGNRFIYHEKIIERNDLDAMTSRLKGIYGVEFREDGRAGIDGTLHRISAIYDRYGILVGVTIRMARVIKGIATPLVPYVLGGKSVLIIGPPGVGKTTLLRDFIRQLAAYFGPKVVVVDTSNEIGGEGKRFHPILGAAKRLQVRIPDPRKGEKHLQMLAKTYYEAVANHGPQIIVGDEVTAEDDVRIVETIGRRGIWAVVTVHGRVLKDILGNPVLHPLIGYPDMDQKRLLATPVFDIGVEVAGKGLYYVYPNLEEAIQALLIGNSPKEKIKISYKLGEEPRAYKIGEGGEEEPIDLPAFPEDFYEKLRQAEKMEEMYLFGNRTSTQTGASSSGESYFDREDKSTEGVILMPPPPDPRGEGIGEDVPTKASKASRLLDRLLRATSGGLVPLDNKV